jgi:hypothetical protein
MKTLQSTHEKKDIQDPMSDLHQKSSLVGNKKDKRRESVFEVRISLPSPNRPPSLEVGQASPPSRTAGQNEFTGMLKIPDVAAATFPAVSASALVKRNSLNVISSLRYMSAPFKKSDTLKRATTAPVGKNTNIGTLQQFLGDEQFDSGRETISMNSLPVSNELSNSLPVSLGKLHSKTPGSATVHEDPSLSSLKLSSTISKKDWIDGLRGAASADKSSHKNTGRGQGPKIVKLCTRHDNKERKVSRVASPGRGASPGRNPCRRRSSEIVLPRPFPLQINTKTNTGLRRKRLSTGPQQPASCRAAIDTTNPAPQKDRPKPHNRARQLSHKSASFTLRDHMADFGAELLTFENLASDSDSSSASDLVESETTRPTSSMSFLEEDLAEEDLMSPDELRSTIGSGSGSRAWRETLSRDDAKKEFFEILQTHEQVLSSTISIHDYTR